jgi:two-component system chemotaxis sensor kinase CheA
MPKMTGSEVLFWIRSNPQLHHTPVVMLSAELTDPIRSSMEELRLLDVIAKPFELDAIKAVINKRTELFLPGEELKHLDKEFAQEARKTLRRTIAEIQGLPNLSADQLQNLSFYLHTFKGDSSALCFPTLALFAHQLEELINHLKKSDGPVPRPLREALIQGLDYLCAAVDQVDREMQITPAPDSLLRSIKSEPILSLKPESAPAPLPLDPLLELQAEADAGITLSVKKILDIQDQFKRVLRQTVQLTGYAEELKVKYSQQDFPTILSSKINALNSQELELFGTLVQALSVPEKKLQEFLERTTYETSYLVDKKVKVDFEVEAGLELDPIMYQQFRYAMIHLIRNALDHGIETPEERQAADKPPEGTLTFTLRSKRRHQVEISLQDDGRGLDPSILRQAAVTKNLLTQDAAARLTDEEVIQLIFHDGFSTRTTSNPISGRGIGLAHVKQIIESNQGKLEVHSSPGKGTNFCLTLTRVLQLVT